MLPFEARCWFNIIPPSFIAIALCPHLLVQHACLSSINCILADVIVLTFVFILQELNLTIYLAAYPIVIIISLLTIYLRY